MLGIVRVNLFLQNDEYIKRSNEMMENDRVNVDIVNFIYKK